MKKISVVFLFSVVTLTLLVSPAGGEDTAIHSLISLDKINKYNLHYMRSTYTTYFDAPESNRAQNIKVGARKLNGTLVKSGETFSFNQIVGPRTRKRGFKPAPEIVNGELVEGIGGGLCQVSSTLYNAVLLADLQVIQRVHHSQPVGYVELGRGATIYYNQIDFKFKNSTSAPILIIAQVIENKLTVSILGQQMGVQVEIVTQAHVLQPKVKKRIDETLPPGEQKVIDPGRKGYRVEVKRIIKKAGEVINQEIISQDIYSPETQIIKINPKQ